jgi:hypothetical protein
MPASPNSSFAAWEQLPPMIVRRDLRDAELSVTASQ